MYKFRFQFVFGITFFTPNRYTYYTSENEIFKRKLGIVEKFVFYYGSKIGNMLYFSKNTENTLGGI